ncbi:hypothetical protein ANN_13430 [Periplaneta americana]|uniref:Reverse transcriptase domain-containing protein n=1 Tax=Periplaneta americana TaxID=6978 RepID=A0ABQ8TLK9_PERAM|nr:hypothetical protein ANN_13430 [Periplaneta americana]
MPEERLTKMNSYDLVPLRNTTKVKLDTEGTPFNIQRGVRQGDPLSPKIFNCVLEEVFRKLPWGRKHGISIDGRKLTNLRFADDVVLFARSRKRLEEMLNELCEESMAVGLKINTSKTKVLTNDAEGQMIVNNANIEFVTQYIYLCQTISFQNSMDKEIDRRIASAWRKF